MTEFDPTEYTRPPVLSVSAGISLARALVSATSAGLSRQVDRAAKRLEKVADEAQAVMVLRQRAAGEDSEGTRAVDSVADASWAALRMRLEAQVLLPEKAHPETGRARQMLLTLFGDEGLAFLRGRYPVQFTVADTILKRIDSDGLQAEIDALAGPEFLANIRAQHERYGDMLQTMWTRTRAKEEDLREHQRRLQRAITSYAIAVCALVDEDEPGTIELAHTLLLPLANYRQQSLRSRGSSVGDATEPPDSPDSDAPAESSDPDTLT